MAVGMRIHKFIRTTYSSFVDALLMWHFNLLLVEALSAGLAAVLETSEKVSARRRIDRPRLEDPITCSEA